MPPYDICTNKEIKAFLDAIGPVRPPSNRMLLSYIAYKDGERFVLIYGRLILDTDEASPFTVVTDNVRAERCSLRSLDIGLEEFLGGLLEGKVATSLGTVFFYDKLGVDCSFNFVAASDEGFAAQQRWNALLLEGHNRVSAHQKVIDWELRSHAMPFDGLSDLIQELKLSAQPAHTIFEIVSLVVVVFDFSSFVADGHATLRIRLAHHAAPTDASLGYKVIDKGKVVSRGVIAHGNFTWEQTDSWRLGTAVLEVQPAAVVQCFANYQGKTQHFGWCGDAKNFQNPRRSIYSLIDNDQAGIKDLIFGQARGKNARLVETGLSRLLWLLGFSVLHLGDHNKTQEFADLVVVSPDGSIGVVECTSGGFKPEKVSNLLSRLHTVRSQLTQAGYVHLNVSPVMVTSRPRGEVENDAKHAEALGVYVVCKEGLEQAIETTMVLPNPDQMIANMRRASLGS